MAKVGPLRPLFYPLANTYALLGKDSSARVADSQLVDKPLWTPMNMEVPPQLFLWGPDATFPSSALSWPNKGTAGGTAIKGSGRSVEPSAGTPMNGLQTINFPANSGAEILMPATSAGGPGGFVFTFYRHTSTSAASQTIFGTDWLSGTSTKAMYSRTSDNKAYWFWDSNDTNQNGNMQSANPAADTTRGHSIFGQIGTTNKKRYDGTDQTLTFSKTGTVASTPNRNWQIGYARFNDEPWLANCLTLVYSPVLPSVADIARLEGWAHWAAGAQDLLPSDHVYKNAPPYVDVNTLRVNATLGDLVCVGTSSSVINATANITLGALTGNPITGTVTSPGPSPVVYLNPSDKYANISLTGSNLIAENTGATGSENASVRGNTAITTNIYFEVTVLAHPGTGNIGIGFAADTFDLSSNPATNLQSAILYDGAGAYYNYNNPFNLGTFTVGDVISVAINTGNFIWWRKNGGDWNASGSANPSTTSGGFHAGSMTTPQYPLIFLGGLGEKVSVNFGYSTFAYSPPASYPGYDTPPSAGGRTGVANITFGAITPTATGAVQVRGEVIQSLGLLTSAGTGMVPVQGALTASLGPATLVSTVAGAGQNIGVSNITLGSLSAAGTGMVPVQAAAAITLGSLTPTATGTVAIQGQLTATLGSLQLIATTGTVPNPGQANITLGALTPSATGLVKVQGQLNATLGGLGIVAGGASPRTGLVNVTLGGIGLSAAGIHVSPTNPSNVPQERWVQATPRQTLQVSYRGGVRNVVVASTLAK